MSKRAFTLLEMLIVMLVLTLTATVVVPRVINVMNSQAENDFRRSLMRVGAEARLLAIETGNTVQVTYNDTERAVTLSTVDPETALEEVQKSYSLPDVAELVSFMVGGDFVSSNDWIVEYYPDGTGTDCGIEVQTGLEIFAVMIEGEDGASHLMGSLNEVEDSEWEAGELERRLQ